MKSYKRLFLLLFSGLIVNAVNAQLTVSFTYSVNGGNVSFNTSTNGVGVNYTWSYGGPISYASGPSVKYVNPGTYYVCVSATDTLMRTANYCDSVVVSCKAKFTSSQNLLTFSFSNNSFLSGNNYSWNFGDGNTSIQKDPNHTYSSAGTYNVCLTVTDSLTNCTNVYCDSIVAISSYQCSANFSYSIVNPGEVAFTDNSWSNYPTLRYWDLDNGDSLRNYPGNWNYQYYNDGTYNVCLTVKDTNSLCVSTYCDSVVITNAPAPPPVFYDVKVQVFKDSNLFFDSLRVYLIMEDTTKSSPYLIAVDSQDIHGNVYPFRFSNKSPGTYYVKAALRPDAVNYSTYLPTYFGDKLLWSNASAIQLNSSANVYLYMIKGTNPGGPGFISGYVSLGANLVPGDPIPGLDVLLLDEFDQAVAHTKSDQDGKYTFSNLALGTYKIYIDLLNIPASPIYVTLDQTNTSSTGNKIEVNSTGVGAPLGFADKTKDENSWIAYPNPFNDQLTISMNQKDQDHFRIEIIDLIGKSLEKIEGDFSQQHTKIQLNTAGLISGPYFLRIQIDDDVTTKKLFKK